MTLTPQSIRNNVLIKMNDEYVHKHMVIALSENWNEQQISYFQKMVKQGGTLKVNGDRFEIIIQETIVSDFLIALIKVLFLLETSFSSASRSLSDTRRFCLSISMF